MEGKLCEGYEGGEASTEEVYQFGKYKDHCNPDSRFRDIICTSLKEHSILTILSEERAMTLLLSHERGTMIFAEFPNSLAIAVISYTCQDYYR